MLELSLFAGTCLWNSVSSNMYHVDTSSDPPCCGVSRMFARILNCMYHRLRTLRHNYSSYSTRAHALCMCCFLRMLIMSWLRGLRSCVLFEKKTSRNVWAFHCDAGEHARDRCIVKFPCLSRHADDEFQFNRCAPDCTEGGLTKRSIPKTVSTVFDFLGILSSSGSLCEDFAARNLVCRY